MDTQVTTSSPSSQNHFQLRTMMSHQRKGLRFLKHCNLQAILAFAPGTGKTLVAIRAALAFCKPPYLVICRRDDFLTWEIELEKEKVPPFESHQIESSKQVPNSSTYDAHTNFGWVFVTYDLMRSKTIQDFVSRVEWGLVIGDELHQIKRPNSKRTKATIKATRHIPCRIGLTGSPLTNEPDDCFSQVLFVDGGRTFGDNHWHFLKKYFLQGHPYGWYVRALAKKVEIPRKLKGVMLHVHEDDVLALPPQSTVIKAVLLSKAQQQAYDHVLYDWELMLKQETREVMEINYVIVQLQKLKQIASGFFYDEFHEAHRLECTKLQLLIDMVSDPDQLQTKEKIVVWCSYTDEILRISDALYGLTSRNVCPFYGEMKRSAREASRLQFRDDPRAKFFVGQVDAGIGMNELVVADTAIYYSNSFKVVSKQQSMRRIRRMGSQIHKAITYYELLSERTVDEKVIKGVSSAMALAQGILNQLKGGVPLRSAIL